MCDIIASNIDTTDYLESVYEQCRSSRSKAYETLFAQLQRVSHSQAEILESDSIPAHFPNDFKFYIDKHQIPMSKYAVEVVTQLANLGRLPTNRWVLPTLFAAQVKNDDNIIFYIHRGLQNAYSNGTVIDLPVHLTPITACALTARNILIPDKKHYSKVLLNSVSILFLYSKRLSFYISLIESIKRVFDELMKALAQYFITQGHRNIKNVLMY